MNSIIVFAGGVWLGAFMTVLILALTTANKKEEPDDFKEYYDAWKEINDEYGVYDDEATIDEMFLGLGDDEDVL